MLFSQPPKQETLLIFGSGMFDIEKTTSSKIMIGGYFYVKTR